MGIRRSLRGKSALAAFVPLVVVVIIATLVGLNLTDRAARGVVRQRDTELARITADRLSERLVAQAEPLQRLAAEDGIRFGGTGVAQATLMRYADDVVGFDGGVLVYDEFGVVRIAAPAPLITQPQWLNYPDRSQLAELREGRELTFSSVFAAPDQPLGVIIIGVPVRGLDGSFQGFVAGVMSLSGGILTSVAEVRPGETGSAYVVDDRGRVIYHNDVSLVGQTLIDEPPVARVTSGTAGALIGDNRAGATVVSGYAPVGNTGWGIVTEEDWAHVVSPLRRTAWGLIAVVLVGAGLSSGVLVFAMGRVLSPIERLSEGAKAIAAGRFDQRIDADIDHELAGLARQFNAMAEAIEASYADLEQRVADRTEENRALYVEAKQRAAELEHLNRRLLAVARTATEVASIIRQDELLQSVVTHLREAFDYRTVYVLLADRNTGDFVLQAGIGRRVALPRGLVVPRGYGMTGWVAEHGEAALIPDVRVDPRFRFFDEVRDTGAGLAVPIRAGDRMLGVLAVEQEAVGSLDETDLVTAQVLADYLAVALENSRLFEQTGDLAVLEERNRMAREIHDTIAQGLTGVVLQLEAAESAAARDPSAGATHIERAKDIARESLQEARRSVWNLLPRALEDLGLEGGLRHAVREFSEGGPEQADFEIVGEARNLSNDVQVAVLRIAQEALTNARKHASAKHVRVVLAFDRDVVSIAVEDDGHGFDDEAAARSRGRGGGFGLEGMSQRARLLGGSLEVGPRPGGGTRVEARIPVRGARTAGSDATVSRA